MLIIDKAFKKRQNDNKPIQVALVGAGFSGKLVAYQIISSFHGIKLSAICNRTLSKARAAYLFAGVEDVKEAKSSNEIDNAIRDRRYTITDDSDAICRAEKIEAIIECTGTVEFGADVIIKAIQNCKHVILLNCELDATLGPILKAYAERAHVVYSNSDGDEPGVAMNLLRYVKSIGLEPVLAGNLKGLYDPYRTPETQKKFALAHNQKATAVTSFVDGTKLSMELTVLANATGFKVGRRGMYGPKLTHVNESIFFYRDKLIEDGMVDFLEGAAPANGAFVIGHSDDPIKADYLKYLKMGEGPLYVFYTPFHLPQLEIPLTVARAVLFKDATITPKGPPVCDAIAVAKRNLKAGEILDGLGGFTCYTLIENYERSCQESALPMGVSEGCRLKKDVRKDQIIKYKDVMLPKDRLCDKLRREQHELFF